MEECLKGCRAGLPDRAQRRPAVEKVAEQQRAPVIEPFQRLRLPPNFYALPQIAPRQPNNAIVQARNASLGHTRDEFSAHKLKLDLATG
jgi:hypothetical protein